jgi:hypothetical protein
MRLYPRTPSRKFEESRINGLWLRWLSPRSRVGCGSGAAMKAGRWDSTTRCRKNAVFGRGSKLSITLSRNPESQRCLKPIREQSMPSTWNRWSRERNSRGWRRKGSSGATSGSRNTALIRRTSSTWNNCGKLRRRAILLRLIHGTARE